MGRIWGIVSPSLGTSMLSDMSLDLPPHLRHRAAAGEIAGGGLWDYLMRVMDEGLGARGAEILRDLDEFF